MNIRFDPEDSSQNQSHQNSAQVRTWKPFWVISTCGVLKHLRGESLRRGGVCGGVAYGGEGPLAEWAGHLQTSLLGLSPFSREGQAEARRLRLSAPLKPLRGFQKQPFARAHRASAWSHVRVRLPLGKAGASQRLSEAELNRPPSPGGTRRAVQKSQYRAGGAAERV